MAMRDRFPLDKIELPKDQERIMDVVCKAWDECDESECKGCIDRKSHFMSIRECAGIKASRMLVEEGYARVVRCKDCTHAQYSKGIGYICEYDNKCRHGMNYCSEGDPREDITITYVEEARKEFAENLKNKLNSVHQYQFDLAEVEAAIDNLVKEMKEKTS